MSFDSHTITWTASECKDVCLMGDTRRASSFGSTRDRREIDTVAVVRVGAILMIKMHHGGPRSRDAQSSI